jgi:adenosylcobinamide kinase/adenosylcobinamide-phosphate guanylyltransferase
MSDRAKIIFILGGARSGKSSFAEGLAKKYTDVVYIATAEVKDDEMRERVRVHRARRPLHWKTVESPQGIGSVISNLKEGVQLAFVDCITLYITNLLFSNETRGKGDVNACARDSLFKEKTGSGGNTISGGEAAKEQHSGLHGEFLKQKEQYILAEINKLCKVCRESKPDIIIVSNEVGGGIVPDNALSRAFRDIAGCANQILAKEADAVYFMIAGIAWKVK